MRTWRLALCLSAAFVGCGDKPKPMQTQQSDDRKSSAKPDATPAVEVSEDAVARHNQAVAMMAQHNYRDAEPILEKLAKEYPTHADICIDHAVVVSHRQKGGATGIPVFEDLNKRFPGNDRIEYGLGFLYIDNDRKAEGDVLLKSAYDRLEKRAKEQPTCEAACAAAHCAYKIGENVVNRYDDRHRESGEWFSKALAFDPFFYTAAFRLQSSEKFGGRPQDAARTLKMAEYLKTHPFFNIAEPMHRRMGPLFDVVSLSARAADRKAPTPAKIAAATDVLLPPTPLLAGAWKAQPSPTATITVCDIDMDGRLDLFFAGVNVTTGDRALPNAVVMQQTDGTFKLAPNHPLAAVADVTAALWGDVDNDGRTDVFLCRKSGNRLWKRNDKGDWSDATVAANAAGPAGECVGGVLFDADHDSDLDVFLVNAAGPNELLRNKGSGVFQAAAKELGLVGAGKGSKQACIADVDGDRIDDLVVVHADGSAEQFLFRATGKYDSKTVDLKGVDAVLQVARRAAWIVGKELVGDGWKTPLERKASGRVAALDLTGDGTDDLVFDGADGRIGFALRDGSGTAFGAEGVSESACWTLANLDPARGPSLVVLPKSGPPAICKPGPGRMEFTSLGFVGDQLSPQSSKVPAFKSNRSGIGVTVRLQIGSRQVVQSDLGRSTAPGQSLQPLAFGLAGRAKADYVFIDWSNGDFQCEYPIEAGKLRVIKELDRTPEDSCPLLFAWDGEKHVFLFDFLGVGGIDYLVRPGEFFTPTDPRENLLLPAGLPKPQGGKLSLTIVEAVEELTLIDRAALVAFDLPPGWQMTLDERHSALNPPVTHEPRFFRKRVTPLKAVDHKKRDVTAALATANGRSAPPNEPDHRLPGRFLEPHIVTLEFAEPLDASAGQPMLIADGWVCYPNAQSVIGAAHAGADFAAPKLEALGADGVWKTVYAEFGYPAGMQRQMSLPLVGLPKGCTKLRIATELQVYWDAFAVAWAEPCPQAKRLPLETLKANLSKVGSPRYTPNEGDRPFGFDFDDRNPFWPVRAHAGLYTRFGDCKELIADADDAPVTVGPGEGIALEFAAPAAPPAGWSRRYVFETRGWCRGMRIYTRNGRTVEPLPTTGKPAEVRDRLIEKYNTRLVGGL